MSMKDIKNTINEITAATTGTSLVLFQSEELQKANDFYNKVLEGFGEIYLVLQDLNWRAASFEKHMVEKNYKLYADIIDKLFLENKLGKELIAEHVEIAQGYKTMMMVVTVLIKKAKLEKPECW